MKKFLELTWGEAKYQVASILIQNLPDHTLKDRKLNFKSYKNIICKVISLFHY